MYFIHTIFLFEEYYFKMIEKPKNNVMLNMFHEKIQ